MNKRTPHVAEETRVPVVEEELAVEKRPVPTGKLRVNKRIVEHPETIDLPLMRENVDVRRVVVGRDIDAIPEVRTEGDTIIVPVVEEVVLVEKRLRLKEELHITRRRRVERHEEQVTVRREEPELEHIDAGGRTEPVSFRDGPQRPPSPSDGPRPTIVEAARVREKRILGEDGPEPPVRRRAPKKVRPV